MGLEKLGCGMFWSGGMGGALGLAMAVCLGVSPLHVLGSILLAALGGLLLCLAASRLWGALPPFAPLEWGLLCLPGVGLAGAVLYLRTLPGAMLSLFFLSTAVLLLLLLGRHKRLSGAGLLTGLALCWFCCCCAMSNLCFSPDSYSYYEMSKTIFSDFGRVNTIRQYIVPTDYGISFPYLYPLLLAVVDRLSGVGMYSGVLLNVYVSLLSALLLPPVSRRLCKRSWPGAAAAIALLTTRQYLGEVLSGRAIPAAVLCVVLLLLVLARPGGLSRRTYALAGFLAGASMAMRFDNMTVVAFLGFCVLVFSGKKRWSNTLCCAVGALVPLLPWIAYSMIHFGTPWISDNGGTMTMVEIFSPQRFYLPDEEVLTLFNAPQIWLEAVVQRSGSILVLLLLTFVSTQVLFPALITAAGTAAGLIRGRRASGLSLRQRLIPVLLVIFYLLKTAAYCLVGYETARYHAETAVMILLALGCLAAPYVSRRLALACTALYLVLALWAGFLYSTPLSQTVSPLCRHPDYARVLSMGFQAQDADWQALWQRVSTQPLLTEETAHMPAWAAQLHAMVGQEDARVFFISPLGDPYAYGAYTGQTTFSTLANATTERIFYLIDHDIRPTHVVISEGDSFPWAELLEERYGLTYVGQAGGNLLYRLG